MRAISEEEIAEIIRLNKAGLNDRIIAERLYYSPATIGIYRRAAGLPCARVNRSPKRYALYDGKTTQFIMEGTSRECAERMGIKHKSFHHAKVYFETGRLKKWEIYEVTEDD